MLLLTLTTDKLSMITSAAVTVDVHVSGQDKNQSTGALADYRLNTAFTTATTLDIAASPGATTTRNVKTIHIRNKHASTSVDVTVQFNQNGTLFELHKVTLLAGEELEYIEGVGFFKHGTIEALNRKLMVTADVINATTSYADITGLTCPLLNAKFYNFIAHLYSVNNATSNGSQYSCNIGAAPTTLMMTSIQVVTPNAGSVATVFGAGTSTARDTAVGLVDTGATTVKLDIISGCIQPNGDGTFAMRCKSETAVAAGITVKKGSFCRIWEATG